VAVGATYEADELTLYKLTIVDAAGRGRIVAGTLSDGPAAYTDETQELEKTVAETLSNRAAMTAVSASSFWGWNLPLHRQSRPGQVA
jgi:hypothetical protein